MGKRLQIKDTDLSICPLGFGTVNAGLDWDGQDAFDILESYVDQGGNLIDTARIYFDFVGTEIARSERVIGQWLKHRGKRDDLVIITKGGHPPKEDLHHSRMSKADMEYDINASLQKLGIDEIDIYFYHRDDKNQPVSDLIDLMEEFRRQGKIRYYACSNWNAERMAEADAYAKSKGYRGFIANQMLYNIGSKYMKPFSDDTMEAMDDKMLTYHKANPQNLAMPYFGVCSGFFHIADAKGLDAVKDSPYYTEKNLEIVKKVNQLREKYNASISQILLGFFYTREFHCVPLYGPQNPEQLKDAMGALEINFDPQDFIF
ncbi:aldo/keto reductase [Acetivibrio sp. MSJd-27]|jgi:oxidoreductase, aldo/keto reductase family protein|uniref:aldo/keto reductase n=1 Tax=Acetivibrio sp. MSJd-27 TaxID=2841523 RepID=UPI0015B0382A|nr:aldo/keto reductase [Acetivibrio sp. MSJd-27]MBU5451056.1 aldo/keto reductase [Acetivibrio sp. MSJd-27]